MSEGRSWDTWTTYNPNDGLYHSYSQWVRNEDFTQGTFHFHNKAQIWHRTSLDGKDWKDLGIIHIGAEWMDLKGHAYWSGSVVVHGGVFHLFYTRGGNESSEVNGDQRIFLAKSSDGHNFRFKRQVLSPDSVNKASFLNTSYTFKTTSVDGIDYIPSLRDPHVSKVIDRDNPINNHFLMLFSSNVKSKVGSVGHGIGVARSTDLNHWTLEAPLLLPKTYSKMQIELPNLVEVDQAKFGYRYLLMASTRSKGKTQILFWGANKLTDKWEIIRAFDSAPKDSYGFNLIKAQSGKLYISYFDEAKMQVHKSLIPLTLSSRSIHIKW